MNIALRQSMTVDEYLAWGDSQPERVRSELINGQVVLLAAERVRHARAKLAAVTALGNAIKKAGITCHVLPDGPAIRIDNHTAYEPDALVYQGDELPGELLAVPNPRIVVEVLSPTTAHTDTSAKLIGYFKVPSVAHYLIIDSERGQVTHHAREQRPETLTAGRVRLDPPGLELNIDDLFG